jgi:hypothetical protein
MTESSKGKALIYLDYLWSYLQIQAAASPPAAWKCDCRPCIQHASVNPGHRSLVSCGDLAAWAYIVVEVNIPSSRLAHRLAANTSAKILDL